MTMNVNKVWGDNEYVHLLTDRYGISWRTLNEDEHIV